MKEHWVIRTAQHKAWAWFGMIFYFFLGLIFLFILISSIYNGVFDFHYKNYHIFVEWEFFPKIFIFICFIFVSALVFIFYYFIFFVYEILRRAKNNRNKRRGLFLG